MTPVFMNKTELKKALDSVPKDEHMSVALCYLPITQIGGVAKWDRREAAEALSKYYRRKAAEYWERHRHCAIKNRQTGTFRRRAEDAQARAVKIEHIMLRWEKEESESENRQAII